MKFIFRAAVGQPYSLAIKPLSASEGGRWPPLPMVVLRCCALLSGGGSELGRAHWRSLLAGFVAVLVRVYADSGAIDFSREEKAVSRAAEQILCCSEWLDGEQFDAGFASSMPARHWDEV